MKNPDPVYIKLDIEEAIDSKRDLLSIQAGILNTMRLLKAYERLRLEEIKSKTKLLRKIKDLGNGLKKLNKDIPKVRVPQKHKYEKVVSSYTSNSKKSKNQEIVSDSNLEAQLKDIQAKLRELQR